MILLDTNALLWIVSDDKRLGVKARTALENADQVCFSSVSISEIALKHMLGRLTVPGNQDLIDGFRESGLSELSLTAEHAAELLNFPELKRHDLFDQMLLAQAKSSRAQLLTSDSILLNLGYSWVRDARL